jgi:hypothetical protein
MRILVALALLIVATANAQTPADIPWLQLWLDATDNTTVTDENGFHPDEAGFNGSVATWADKSPSGFVASSPVEGRPAYDPLGMNGHPTITFGGGQHFALNAESITSDETIFVVTRMIQVVSGYGPWVGHSNPLPHGVPGSFFNDADRYFIGTDEALFGYVPSPVPTSDTIVVENRNGGVADIFENGSGVVTALEAPGRMIVNQVGRFGYLDRTFDGEISEILIFNRSLDEAEMDQVGSYLAGKYGLETDYPDPYITASIEIEGGTLHECSANRGTEVTARALVTVTSGEVESIDWTIDDEPVGSGETITAFLELGTHEIDLTVTATTGVTDEASATADVIDTFAPDVMVTFVDRTSGNEVTTATFADMRHIVVAIEASDLCDPAPLLKAVAGTELDDGDSIPLRGRGLVIPSPLSLIGTAQDSAGNVGSDEATLTIVP